jgi:N-acetylmuramoyl-L-alanine amidase
MRLEQQNETSWLRIVLNILLILALAAGGFFLSFFVVSRLIPNPEGTVEEVEVKKATRPSPDSPGSEPITTTPQPAVPAPTEPTPPPTEPEPAGPLAGKIICIDPGHQAKANSSQEPVGPGAAETKPKVSSGTRGVSSKVAESKVVLAIGLKLRDALQEQGATVVMTRTKQDVDVPNSERAASANEAHADLFLRLHCDGGANSRVHGISMLVPKKNKWTAPIVKSSASAGEAIQKAVIATTGAKDNGVVQRGDLSGFNYCEVPSILVEMGFMTNKAEDKKLNDDSYQTKLAKGMTQGCIDWLTD